MNLPVAIVLGAVITALVLFAIWLAWRRARQKRRQLLATAFIGEITAILKDIDAQNLVAMLNRALFATDGDLEIENIVLSRCAVYEENKENLDIFGGSLSLEISSLFHRLADLPKKVVTLKDCWVYAALGRGSHTQHLLDDVNQTLHRADDILLALRPIAFPRNAAKHLN